MRIRRNKFASYRPQKRIFVCPECGEKRDAIKYEGKTKPGHIKTMWCFSCEKETDHLQIE